MPDLIVTMGIPGCGKSTFIENAGEGFVRISTDDLREKLSGDASNQDVNNDVFKLAHLQTASALRSGHDVFFDSTALTADARKALLKVARDEGVGAALVVFRIPFAVCMERNKSRDRVVPDNVMYLMHERFHRSLSQIGHEGWKSIIFVDGDGASS